MPDESKSIRIGANTYERLVALKRGNQTVDDIVGHLLDFYDQARQAYELWQNNKEG